MAKKHRLSGTSKPIWERCGHTPFYRRFTGPFPSAAFIDPFNWAMITVSSIEEQGPEAGTFTVGYRKVPHYDWDSVKAGVPAVRSTREEQLRVLKAVHEWAHDVIMAKGEKPKLGVLVKMFEELPEDVREDVLDGVAALVEYNVEQDFVKGTEMVDIMLLVILSEALRSGKMDPKGSYPGIDRVIIADTPEEGLDMALEHFGIHEC